MSEIPLIVKYPIQAYFGHRLRVGTFEFTAAVGDFTGTRVVLRFDVHGTVVLTLSSDGDEVDWFDGSIVELELSDEHVAALAAVGKTVRCIVTLEGAGDPADLDPLAIFTVEINI